MARTTREDIQGWLQEAQRQGATHLVVATDTFDYEDYPIYVKPGQSVQTVVTEHNGPNMQKVMEVYAMHLPIESQIREHRAWHLEEDPELTALLRAREANRRKGEKIIEKLTKLMAPKSPKKKSPKRKPKRKTVWSRLRKPEV